MGFGECLECGCSVERVGWDDLCFRCQEMEADYCSPDSNDPMDGEKWDAAEEPA